ncbi:hypothetical protein GlitD10_2210 [Gloeomargarita lithophora Alchichica-D10]|uniref:LysM domain-containing protein n=1 Tax=Gloeomargarita lithophora Alchichica-D10 TaxID=1188229 RepID=A0A1J0AF61_9CYAN|nr:DUF928 domain-containing protein [Gloeomargarita lithophora]APB34539.1 hypothetical protein GlitD10_2210 [Gloeomargarita lithophora Alchichica-D10]
MKWHGWIGGLLLGGVVGLTPAGWAQSPYTVRLGDTLTGIARRHNLTLEQMLQTNPSLRNDPDVILVGQKLVLPGGMTPTVRTALATPLPPTVQPRVATTTSRRRPAFASLNLPTVGRPGNREGGSKRGSGCAQEKTQKLRVLLPEGNYGQTLQDYATFFWYVPELERPTPVEFQLRRVNAQGQPSELAHSETFTSSGGGIGSLTLPATVAPLAVGQEYEWSIAVQCGVDGMASEPDAWMIALGRIERVSPENPQLTGALTQANLGDYPAILAEAGIWYDALQMLVALRRQNPTDQELLLDWGNLLGKIGFGAIANQPLRCVQPNPQGGVARCS